MKSGLPVLGVAVIASLLCAPRPLDARDLPAPVFEPNRGQARGELRFVARGAAFDLGVTADGAVLATRGACPEVIRLRVEGAAAWRIEGDGEQPGLSHYLRGSDPACWATDVPRFARVISRGIRDGVDLVWHATSDGQLEHDFVLAPGISPSSLDLRFEGAGSLWIDVEGNLHVATPGGAELLALAPDAWQERDETIERVSVRWELRGNASAGFSIGEYDPGRALVIDPVVAYSSYLGGRFDDEPQRIAVDPAGDVYLAGYTDSPDFPLAAPIAVYQDLSDVFVTKLDGATGRPIYSTYIGGLGDDFAFGLAVDGAGRAVIAGETDSPDFPLVAAEQPLYGGNFDAFVVELDPAGSSIVYSSYLGGSEEDSAFGVAWDGQDGILITGRTASLDFPVASPFQPLFGGGFFDAFLTRLAPASSALTYSTYLGGSDDDEAFDVVADATARPYLTGDTLSVDFPLMNARQPVLAGFGADAFVTRFASSGAALELSTFLGGSDDDWGSGIALGPGGDILVGGTTYSDDFPIRGPIFAPATGVRGYLTRLLPDGSDLVYSTLFGGSGGETAVAFAVDSLGGAYLGGLTASSDLPLEFGPQPFPGGGVSDGFVARIDPAGAVLTCSSYIGGSGQDAVIALAAIDPTHLVLAGWTDSRDLATANAFQGVYAGGAADGFFLRLGCGTAPGDVGNTLFLAKDLTDTRFALAWTDPAETASNRIYLQADKSEPFTSVLSLAAGGSAVFPIGPEPLQFFRVSAGNCCGEGPR